ncbi:uncharacterized protein ARMOST_21622 [Armillaria ostoyae]|uniref:Uncharacterized protein n=1 Tax=Armillaria ostoyae TaxID=47428 RepID=A0A284SAM0_ARMOS|nr:uncharacterized protein ARMOST_21622 [Armillaria ostoyae]
MAGQLQSNSNLGSTGPELDVSLTTVKGGYGSNCRSPLSKLVEEGNKEQRFWRCMQRCTGG